MIARPFTPGMKTNIYSPQQFFTSDKTSFCGTKASRITKQTLQRQLRMRK